MPFCLALFAPMTGRWDAVPFRQCKPFHQHHIFTGCQKALCNAFIKPKHFDHNTTPTGPNFSLILLVDGLFGQDLGEKSFKGSDKNRVKLPTELVWNVEDKFSYLYMIWSGPVLHEGMGNAIVFLLWSWRYRIAIPPRILLSPGSVIPWYSSCCCP